VLRNGWFSYRWTQIFDMGSIPPSATVLKARPVAAGRQAAFAPAPIEEVVAAIRAQRPAVVFAPHVETSSGIILPDAYLRAVADATHAVGRPVRARLHRLGRDLGRHAGTGVDVLISAPQKGWSGSPCCALRDAERPCARAHRQHHQHQLRLRPAQVAADHGSLRGGGFAYHATMPTDALAGCAT
jgi:aspartate aminotransferase-like enzyme